MTNSEILAAPASTLIGLDKQRRFVLRMAMTPAECPACQSAVTQIDAIGGDVDRFQVDYSHAAEVYRCPHCRRELEWCVPFMGPNFWRLKHPLPPAGAEAVSEPEANQ